VVVINGADPKPEEFTVPGIAAWLRQRVSISGVDPVLVRLEVEVAMDPDAVPTPNQSEEMRQAFAEGRWWYTRCRVAVQHALMPTGKTARWIELGSAEIRKVVEGIQPGSRFVSVLEDGVPLWLDLAQAAVNEAAETLEALNGVTVEWCRDDVSPLTS
jgi:hypothetical protein